MLLSTYSKHFSNVAHVFTPKKRSLELDLACPPSELILLISWFPEALQKLCIFLAVAVLRGSPSLQFTKFTVLLYTRF